MTIGERIKFLRKEILNLTQQEFADALNISRSNLGNIEIGRVATTDRTRADICSKYNVSPHWLSTGVGDPLIQPDRDEEIAAWVGKVLSGDDDFKKDFIAVLSRLDENAWSVLAQIAQNMVDQRMEHKKKSEP